MCTRDDLTGVYDRSSILDRLEVAAREAGSLTLIFMDLDNLMRFNDQYGFQGGDQWIKAMVKLFAEAFGADDLIGRYGGDEFLAGVCSKDLHAIFDKVETLRQYVETSAPPIHAEGKEIYTGYTVSFGLAAYPLNATDTTDLVEKAKLALYRAKESGGNHVCFYEEKDSLTGLLNYYGGIRYLEEAMLRAQKQRDNLSVIMFDIDFFKQINDEQGHRTGDEILKRVGHILSANFKEVGHIARTGGDEFTIILPGQRADSAFVLAEEVRKLVEDSEIWIGSDNNRRSLHFHITGGIATYPADGNDRVDLLRKADEALYRAKQTGRNRICLPASAQMVTKTSHYTQAQLERLAAIARKLDKSEAYLLREALDDLLRKYRDE